MIVEWIPEKYPRSGGLAAAGFAKLLGRPSMDPLTVLVRETAQNSWDARQDNAAPVIFKISGGPLTESQLDALRNRVFVNAGPVLGTLLSDSLTRNGTRGLYISDRNTKGLGGPLNADEESANGVYDWVDFVHNVGKPNTSNQSGGTYGFGKTISYIISTVRTVLIHSHALHQGRMESRFMACTIGDEFIDDGTLYTGRHWWGVSDNGSAQPIVGVEADLMANAVGMPFLGSKELGTNLLILSPDFGGRSDGQGMRFISESILWNLWPKMMDRGGGKVAMDISVSWDGQSISVPKPVERPPLQGFEQAFRALLDTDRSDVDPLGTRRDQIEIRRPKLSIGELVTVPVKMRERIVVDDGSDSSDIDSLDPAASIVGACHHVALMRGPELIVKYLEGPASPQDGVEWAGVFRVNSEQDRWFAESEPATHDTWKPDLIPDRTGRSIVNVALKAIKSAVDDRWAEPERKDESAVPSTAVVAEMLSSLVRSIAGSGRGREYAEGRPGDNRVSKAPRVQVLSAGPGKFQGAPVTVTKALITHIVGTSGTRMYLRAGVALDGATSDSELDPNLRLLSAKYGDSVVKLSGVEQNIELIGGGQVEVTITIGRSVDTTVLLDLQAEGIE